MTLYPQTKVSPGRAIDMIEMYGAERICVASACDWGASEPTAVPNFIFEMRRRGHPDRLIQQIVYQNPVAFLGRIGDTERALPERGDTREVSQPGD